ncbi:sensor histidine kinase [Microbispora sp. NPDC049125]|uniref:sensor histidine kinase n=1 Tax=Microbispora sp. NPDC049125 TaxID=3154929 RepID=UPI003465879F
MSEGRGLSVTTRITVLTGVVGALLCVLLGVVLMTAINRLANAYLTDEVKGGAGRVSREMELGALTDPIAPGPIRYIQVVDEAGRVFASTPELRGRPPMARFTPPDDNDTAQTVICGGVFAKGECAIVVAQWAHRAGRSWIVYSAAPRFKPWVHPVFAVLLPTATALLAGTIIYLGRRIATVSMRPVREIRAELDEINATCPGRRVPVPPGDDDIHALAESVNHTLGRLQTAMEQQRQFASDASHDLRSPITAMRAEVEDALLAPDKTDVKSVAGAMLRSLDRLQAIVCDLLTIARLDAAMPGERDPVDLAELVTAELKIHQHRTKRIECHLQAGVVVFGDWLRLGRLFTNLLDNAERHAESAIAITVRHDSRGPCDPERFPDGAAVMEVLDDGAGIPPDKRELVFQRFARLDSARARDTGGTGLGLPIARQIAESCGGTLRIEDSDKGARFVLCLPAAAGPPLHGASATPPAAKCGAAEAGGRAQVPPVAGA